MQINKSAHVIVPQWPAPENVQALSTTRAGGFSQGVYHSNNFGTHVGDDAEAVEKNRQQLMDNFQLPSVPVWMNQVHSQQALAFENAAGAKADACYSLNSGEVCVVMTADCLPVLMTNRQGTRVAAAHAGWRGLLDGILENTVAKLECPAEQLLVWLGPAIGPKAFEVGDDVRNAFIQKNAASIDAFQALNAGKWLADIYHLARQRLIACGVNQIFGGEFCTFNDSDRFFSYRRDGVCGRMASLIWLDK